MQINIVGSVFLFDKNGPSRIISFACIHLFLSEILDVVQDIVLPTYNLTMPLYATYT
jgi:hypothetical protein